MVFCDRHSSAFARKHNFKSSINNELRRWLLNGTGANAASSLHCNPIPKLTNASKPIRLHHHYLLRSLLPGTIQGSLSRRQPVTTPNTSTLCLFHPYIIHLSRFYALPHFYALFPFLYTFPAFGGVPASRKLSTFEKYLGICREMRVKNEKIEKQKFQKGDKRCFIKY